MKSLREKIRNVAIIAHVDHGKTTIVDQLLRQSGTFRANQVVDERVMDSNDIEKERGITILSKNTAINYEDYKINIVDTPGHADFGGEVERVLKMVDGVVLVVDAFEGAMPQTKFVLKNALGLDLPIVVCVNKIDRPEARVSEVEDEILELFIELDANDEQLDCKFVYASAKNGYAMDSMDEENDNFTPLFNAIINEMPCPSGDEDGAGKVLVSTIDYDEYTGRIGVGKVEQGSLKVNDQVTITNMIDESVNYTVRITNLYEFEGLKKVEVKETSVGNIIAISGIQNINIGDTISDISDPSPIAFSKISEPTLAMTFLVNDSPFAGQEGKFVTSRQLRDRLFKELNTDVSLRVEETDSADSFRVLGRGELHLSILIENLRREGYEFQVSKPKVMLKEENGVLLEPMEEVVIDVPEEFVGAVIEKLGSRKGEMLNMAPGQGGYTRLTFSIPARGLIGYRSEFLTDTKGNGLINTIFDKYDVHKGEIAMRSRGSIVALEAGDATSYGLGNAQERGLLFISPQTKVYTGMVVGLNSRVEDLDVNVCKRKQLTNMRASGSDDSIKLATPVDMSLEQCIEFIGDDELVEVTPVGLRLRKKVLDPQNRKRMSRNK